MEAPDYRAFTPFDLQDVLAKNQALQNGAMRNQFMRSEIEQNALDSKTKALGIVGGMSQRLLQIADSQAQPGTPQHDEIIQKYGASMREQIKTLDLGIPLPDGPIDVNALRALAAMGTGGKGPTVHGIVQNWDEENKVYRNVAVGSDFSTRELGIAQPKNMAQGQFMDKDGKASVYPGWAENKALIEALTKQAGERKKIVPFETPEGVTFREQGELVGGGVPSGASSGLSGQTTPTPQGSPDISPSVLDAAVDAALKVVIPSLVEAESGWNPNAVSPKGAKGLGQVMDATGAKPGYGVAPLANNSPAENLRFTRDYLKALFIDNFKKSVSAYNQGQGNLEKKGVTNPQYVQKVLDRPVGMGSAAKALAVEQAKNEAASQNLPYVQQKQDIETKADIEKAQAKAEIDTQKDIKAQQLQMQMLATKMLNLLEMKFYGKTIQQLIKESTESSVGAGVDLGGRAIGYADDKAIARDKLKKIAAWLTSMVPRDPGSQSNFELENYMNMVGSLGDATPAETRLETLETIKTIFKAMKEPVDNPPNLNPPASELPPDEYAKKLEALKKRFRAEEPK